MSSAERDEIFWQLTALEEAPEESLPAEKHLDAGELPIAEETLIAYREGTLSPPEMETVERHLAQSQEARDALAGISGIVQEAPKGPREALLAGLAIPAPSVAAKVGNDALGDSADSTLSKELPPPIAKHKTTGRRLLSFAAGLLFSIGLIWLWNQQSGSGQIAEDSTLPTAIQLPEFVVEINLPSAMRSAPSDSVSGPAEGEAKFAAENTVELLVQPWQATAGLEFGLYRLRDNHLERLDGRPEISRQLDRGVAVFSAKAGDLVGPTPGKHTLLVVVTQAGNLPEERDLRPGENPVESLKMDGERRVIAQSLTLLD